jgi:hypothetical protein
VQTWTPLVMRLEPRVAQIDRRSDQSRHQADRTGAPSGGRRQPVFASSSCSSRQT